MAESEGLEEEGEIGDAGGGFAAEEEVFNVATLEGEVCGGEEGSEGGEEGGLGIDSGVFGGEEGVIGRGALKEEDGVVEVATFGSGEEGGEFHGAEDGKWGDWNGEEESAVAEGGGFAGVGDELVLGFDFHHEAFIGKGGESEGVEESGEKDGAAVGGESGGFMELDDGRESVADKVADEGVGEADEVVGGEILTVKVEIF